MTIVHPTAVVGEGVELGEGCVVGPHAVLYGPLVVGPDTWIGPGVVIGTPPEVRGVAHTAQWAEPPAGLGVRIGARTVLRELSTVHGGWQATTVIGDDCFVMNKVYVAHDGVLEDGATLASSVTLGGHVRIGAGANLGMGTVVHQRRRVGPVAMVGMGAVVTRDVPPFAKSYGSPARVMGTNSVGLQRLGIDPETVAGVLRAHAAGRPVGPDDVPAEVAARFAGWFEGAE